MSKQTIIILVISLLIIGIYLLVEHKVHVFGNLQYILFGIFILAHLFMHAGHGGHSNHETKQKEKHL